MVSKFVSNKQRFTHYYNLFKAFLISKTKNFKIYFEYHTFLLAVSHMYHFKLNLCKFHLQANYSFFKPDNDKLNFSKDHN